jgi:hypothetical protein
LVVAEDIVSGTLGATTTGGGANAVLSLLLIIAAAILLAEFKRGLISGPRLCLCLVILMLPIVLNSNRVALVYLVLVYLMLFSGEILKAPLKGPARGRRLRADSGDGSMVQHEVGLQGRYVARSGGRRGRSPSNRTPERITDTVPTSSTAIPA